MRLLKKNRRWRRVRLHFWLFVDPVILEHFFALAKEGQFGDIRRAEGHGQDRLGRPLAFVYEDGRLELARSGGKEEGEPGWMELAGNISNEDLIQMRNHTAFHLRGFFKNRLDTLHASVG